MKKAIAPQYRRRIIFLNYSSFVSLGLIGGALGPGLPTLARQMNVGLDAAGGLVSSISVGYLTGGLLAGPLADTLGRRPVYLTALGITAAGLLALLCVPALTLGLLAAFFLGLGQSSIDVSANVVTGDTNREERGAALNRLHFFFGAGALIGPLLVGYSLQLLNGLWPAFGLIATLILFILAGMSLTPLPAQSPTHSQTDSNARTVIGRRAFWLLAAFFFLYVGVEVGVGTWAFAFLREGLGTEVTLASWVASGFFLALTGGRLIGSRLVSQKIADEKLVLVGLGGAISGAALLCTGGAVRVVAPLIVGVLAVGFCFGPVYPTALGLAQRRYPKAAGTVVGLLTAMAGLGGSFLPWLQGWLLARSGLLWGVAATGVGTVALLVVATAVIPQRVEA